MDITDTTHSLLLISEELMQQDTADHLERPVRQLSQYLYSHQIEGWTLKVLNFLAGKTSMLNHPIIKCSFCSFVSYSSLIIFVNVLTPQPTEQFWLYCSNTFGGHCIYFSITPVFSVTWSHISYQRWKQLCCFVILKYDPFSGFFFWTTAFIWNWNIFVPLRVFTFNLD